MCLQGNGLCICVFLISSLIWRPRWEFHFWTFVQVQSPFEISLPNKTEISRQAVWLNGKMPTRVCKFHNSIIQKDQTNGRNWIVEQSKPRRSKTSKSNLRQKMCGWEWTQDVNQRELAAPALALLGASSRRCWLVRLEANCGWKSKVGHCSSC